MSRLVGFVVSSVLWQMLLYAVLSESPTSSTYEGTSFAPSEDDDTLPNMISIGNVAERPKLKRNGENPVDS